MTGKQIIKNIANILNANPEKIDALRKVQGITFHNTCDDFIYVRVELYEKNIERYLIEGTGARMTITANALTKEIVRKPGNEEPWHTEGRRARAHEILNEVRAQEERKQENGKGEYMEILTNIGFVKADTERLSASEKDLCRKLERDRATLHRAGELKRDHGMIFPETEPDSLVLCEEDTGRWYIVETMDDIIIGFEEMMDYIEGFKAEEIEALRSQGFFRDGDAYYITGEALKRENVDWSEEEKDMIQNLEDKGVYYWDDSVDYICHLNGIENASRIFY